MPATHATEPMLALVGLGKTYHHNGNSFEAVRDLTFAVAPGEFVCIVGPSGCGKTTLLRCIAGLIPPSLGEVAMESRLVTEPPKGMAVVFQDYARSLFPWLTVRQNVELPLKDTDMSRAKRRENVEQAVDAVGLAQACDKYPWQLSGGMQQRVAIARAVAYEPHVLLMDEPFAAVDAQTRADLEDLVRSLWHRLGVTVLFVTHDIDESIYLGERVIILSSSPTVVLEDLRIDLPDERDQLSTRSLPRFAELRHHVYRRVQEARRGYRDPGSS